MSLSSLTPGPSYPSSSLIPAKPNPDINWNARARTTATKNNFKVVFLGKSGVGKTSVTLRFCRDTFLDGTEATIGASFLTKMLTISERQIKFEMWYVLLPLHFYLNEAGTLPGRSDTAPSRPCIIETPMLLSSFTVRFLTLSRCNSTILCFSV